MNIDNTVHAIADELIAESTDDFIGLWAIPWKLTRALPNITDSELLTLTVSVVSSLLDAGLVAGQFNAGHFEEWKTPPSETLDRIQREWAALGRVPTLGEIVWFVSEAFLKLP